MRMPRPALLAVATALAAGLVGTLPGSAPGRPAAPYPRVIDLPDGFQPEGITIRGKTAWFGSLADGSVYEVALRTGRGRVVSEGSGTPAVGLKIDQKGRLFIAGGPSGTARVVDSGSGNTRRTYELTTDEAFVNDVVLTREAVWFTDSAQAQLYALPLGGQGGLPDQDEVVTLPLTGEWKQGTGFGANGIEVTPDRTGLLVVNSTTGRLYRVDPATGGAETVDLGGTRLKNGDGLLVLSRRLLVVQNQKNRVAVVRLDRSGTNGEVRRFIRSDDFDTPTTVAARGERLYLPNARFASAPDPTPSTPYTAVQVPLRR